MTVVPCFRKLGMAKPETFSYIRPRKPSVSKASKFCLRLSPASESGVGCTLSVRMNLLATPPDVMLKQNAGIIPTIDSAKSRLSLSLNCDTMVGIVVGG